VGEQGEWYQSSGNGGSWFRFFLKIAGIILAGGAIAVILLFVYSRAVVAIGFLGAFLLIALILIVLGRLYDRRQARRAPE
jgi:Flp pilus assembly protein TadB